MLTYSIYHCKLENKKSKQMTAVSNRITLTCMVNHELSL